MRGRSRQTESPTAAPAPRAGAAILACGHGSGCGCQVAGEREVVQRYAGNHAVAQAMGGEPGDGGLPPSVSTALSETGEGLEPDLLDAMEGAFGGDLGSVRVHAGPGAARAADDLGALAFTAGSHIVFGAGQYRPATPEGRRLLAHELTHVRQQAEGRTGMLAGTGGDASARAALERDASTARVPSAAPAPRRPGAAPGRNGGPAATGASGVVAQSVPAPAPAGGAIQMQTNPASCLRLLAMPGRSDRATGIAVHAAIRADFRRRVGQLASFSFPDASADPQRTERRPDVIPPQIGGGLRQGTGNPDLAFRSRTGAAMLLAEIKPANWIELAEGETQLANYISKGNSDDNRSLRQRLGVKVFSPMLPSRYRPPRSLLVLGRRFQVAWCGPGLLVYKEIQKKKKKKKKKQNKKKRSERKKQKKSSKKTPKKSPKKTTKKPAKGKPRPKKAKPKTAKGGAQAGAFNFGLGLSIGSTGAGAGNIGVGVSIMSSGVSVGTVSAGIVYDSEGAAIASVGAGAVSSSSGAGAGTAGVGTTKDSMTAAAGAAGAGESSGVTGAVAGVAGSGSAKDVTGTAAGRTGSGDVEGGSTGGAGKPGGGTKREGEGGEGAGGGVKGEGATKGEGGGAAKREGEGGSGGAKREGEGGTGAGGEGKREGEAGGTGEREGAGEGAGGAGKGESGGAGEREGAGRGGTGTREGAGGSAGGAGGAQTTTVSDSKLAEIVARLGLPKGKDAPGAEKVVVDAIKLDQLVSRATPAQKLLMRVLAASSETGVYRVPEAAWVEMMLSATAGLTEKDLEFLAELEWEPANITLEELRKAIQEALARAREAHKTQPPQQKDQRAGKPPDPSGGKPPEKGEARATAEGKGGGRRKFARRPKLSGTPLPKIVAELSGLPWAQVNPGRLYYREDPKPQLVFGVTSQGTRYGALVNFQKKKIRGKEAVQVKESSAIVVLDDTKEGEALQFTSLDGEAIFLFIEGTPKNDSIDGGGLFVNLIVEVK